MDELDLDAKEYAEAIAEGLAILHWGAGVDGREVEFVLGSRGYVRRERGILSGYGYWISISVRVLRGMRRGL
jgi:hypothetical protein